MGVKVAPGLALGENKWAEGIQNGRGSGFIFCAYFLLTATSSAAASSDARRVPVLHLRADSGQVLGQVLAHDVLIGHKSGVSHKKGRGRVHLGKMRLSLAKTEFMLQYILFIGQVGLIHGVHHPEMWAGVVSQVLSWMEFVNYKTIWS